MSQSNDHSVGNLLDAAMADKKPESLEDKVVRLEALVEQLDREMELLFRRFLPLNKRKR